MTLVIAAFDAEQGLLASEGRVSHVDGAGKVHTQREDFWKHLQLDRDTAFAAAGAGQRVVPALQLARDIGEAFHGRCTDLGGALTEFFARFVARAPRELPDSPVPIEIVVLYKDSAGQVKCGLVVSGRKPETFQVSRGAGPQYLIFSPCDSTSNFVRARLQARLPRIFHMKSQEDFAGSAIMAIGAIVREAAEKDSRINGAARFAVLGADPDLPTSQLTEI